MNKFYSVLSPPFDVISGGIRVMYGLYGALLMKGQVAYLNSTADDGNFIAIYPEIYQGNPTGAKTVVRYLLNKPGAMALYGTPGPTSFNKTDLIYTFSRMYYETTERHVLFLPILDLHVFKNQKKLRNKVAYYVGKGENTNQHPDGAILITRQLAVDQQELANLLNECQVLYSYDPVSAMTEIARLCGCRVVMLQKTYSIDDYRKYEPGLNGMSFNKDEEVPLEIQGFRNHYSKLRMIFSEKLNDFIGDTQKYAERN